MDDRARRSDAQGEPTFRLAVERSSDIIFTTTPDGTITYVNPAFERLYGFTRAEAVGFTPRILKSGMQDATFYQDLWARLLSKEVVPVEVINKTKDGRLVHIEATANPMLDERGQIIGFLAIQRDVTERSRVEQRLRESEEALRESEAEYRGLFDNSPMPTWVFDIETMRFLAVNEAAIKHYGYSREEFLRMRVTDIRPPEEAPRLIELAGSAQPGVLDYGLWKHRKKDGTPIDAQITGQTVLVRDCRCMIVYAKDVTEQRRMEDKLRQAQKMEAVGRLAGGVAHDFNNVLSVILSYATMAVESLDPSNPLYEDLSEIEKAGRRAAELTGQLLAFSRRQVLQPRVVDLNQSLAGIERMLRRLLGEDVELIIRPAPSLWTVKVDPGQIEQVLMNLAVNARDAMPGGGTLTIETSNVEPPSGGAQGPSSVKHGPHVRLTVADTGEGMDEATRSRIFDPFFTTKEVGKGTGLGLATVLGIVEQSGGSIRVKSDPGAGTTFSLLFPRAVATSVAAEARPSLAPAHRTGETILLVEDEAHLRKVLVAILRRTGYAVLAAGDPSEALRLSEEHRGEIHLLVTDVVMPGMNGHRLAERLTAARAGTKVLFMSGYTGTVGGRPILEEGVPFLPKPITHSRLLRKVREVLDG